MIFFFCNVGHRDPYICHCHNDMLLVCDKAASTDVPILESWPAWTMQCMRCTMDLSVLCNIRYRSKVTILVLEKSLVVCNIYMYLYLVSGT